MSAPGQSNPNPRTSGPKPPFPPQEQPPPGSEREMSPRPDHGEETYVGHQRLEGRVAESFGANTRLGRPAQPAELAPTYVFLASDESRFITSEVIGVAGGETLA